MIETLSPVIVLVLNFEFPAFGFVSYFEIRISDFLPVVSDRERDSDGID
jgi:hypothetical protein